MTDATQHTAPQVTTCGAFLLTDMKSIPHLRLTMSRRVNITKWLERHEGGKWKYDGVASWWCDDGVRHLSRVATSSCDENSGTAYHLYGGNNPRWIFNFN